jgi:hypothetical protein
MINKMGFMDVVAAVADGSREKPIAFFHTWSGWVSKGVLHIKSGSGARAREIWHFSVEQSKGSDILFKNTTGTAFCYTQRSPEQETDPLRKVLRLLSLPTTIIHYHRAGEEIELKGTWAHVDCNIHNARSSVLKTDATNPIVEGQHRKGPGYYKEEDWSIRLTDAAYAVIVGQSTDADARISRRIWEIHLWGQPDIAPVAKVVCEWMRGAGASVEMLQAERGGKAQRLDWVAKNIAPGSAPWLLRIGNAEFPLYYNGRVLLKGKYQYPESNNAVAETINYGELDSEEILSVFPEQQRAYERAFADKAMAIEWLSANSRFFSKSGKLYILDSPGSLREVDGRYEQSGPVAILNRYNLRAEMLAAASPLGDPIPLVRRSCNEYEGEGDVKLTCKTLSGGMFCDVKASAGYAAINNSFSFQVYKI